MSILDVGCGPGTITVDLARHVPEGYVVGVEYANKPLSAARQLAETEQVTNVQFAIGDALHLNKYADDTFDVVHTHQMLQHVSDPVRALKEMRRVVKPGGIIAARDIAAFNWYPRFPELDLWHKLHVKVGKDLGGNPDPGSYIHVWAQEAGFARRDITCSAGAECFSTSEETKWWGDIWTRRVLTPQSIENAVDKGGYCTREDMFNMANVWEKWGRDENGWFTTTFGEIICRK
jgi:SAM-dependent methyltransferase